LLCPLADRRRAFFKPMMDATGDRRRVAESSVALPRAC
jgi:hypothetical protein